MTLQQIEDGGKRIRRPLNPFMVWSQQERRKLSVKMPGAQMSKCQNARWEDVEMSKCQVSRCQNARCWEDVKTRICVMQCYHQWMTIWRFMTYYLIYSFISYVQLPSVNNYLKIRNLLSDSQFCAVCLCLQPPELHMAEISCLLGRLWRNLSPVEKLPFMKGSTDVHGVSRCLSYVESYLLSFEPWEGTVI